MLVAYVAGPYRAPSEWEVLGNIRRAEQVALQLWRLGFAVICPHKNTAFLGGAAKDEVWLRGDKELLRRSDVLVAVEGWQESEGASSEVGYATDLDMPRFEWPTDAAKLLAWKKEQEDAAKSS